MSEIIMPKMGDAMTEGKVVRWYKKAGDAVKKGEPVLEIETDKVNLDLEAEQDGTLGDLDAKEGQVVQVGGRLAEILGAGEKSVPGRSGRRYTEERRTGGRSGNRSTATRHRQEGQLQAHHGRIRRSDGNEGAACRQDPDGERRSNAPDRRTEQVLSARAKDGAGDGCRSEGRAGEWSERTHHRRGYQICSGGRSCRPKDGQEP